MDKIVTTKNGVELWVDSTYFYSQDIREVYKALQADQMSKDPVAQYFAWQVFERLKGLKQSAIKY